MNNSNSEDFVYSIQKLKDSSDPTFVQCLRVSHLSLTTEQVSEYFEILLSHFSSKFETKYGNEILVSICSVIDNDENASVFVQNGCVDSLPFAQKQYFNQILDILFILVRKAPNIFNDRISSHIASYCEDAPRKCLTLVVMFSQQLEQVDNVLPMLDILFHRSEDFRRKDCINDYISLIIWLLKNCDEFRSERLQHSWTYLCDMLIITSAAVLNTIYCSLCSVYDLNPDLVRTFGYPSEAINVHLKHPSTQAQVLSLMIRYPPPYNSKYMDQIIITLSEIAKKEEKALLLLLGLVLDEDNAKILLQHSGWMCNGCPQILDTLKLFGAIMLHKNLRSRVVKCKHIIPFFTSLLEINSLGVCNAVCSIMRRLPLTDEFLDELSNSGFLAGYFAVVQEINDVKVQISALRLLNILTRVKFLNEYLRMTEFVIVLIRNNSELIRSASNVSVKLVRYPECAKIFREEKMDEFFSQSFTDERMSKYARKFMNEYKKIDFGDLR